MSILHLKLDVCKPAEPGVLNAEDYDVQTSVTSFRLTVTSICTDLTSRSFCKDDDVSHKQYLDIPLGYTRGMSQKFLVEYI
jgi:hypothetical protein